VKPWRGGRALSSRDQSYRRQTVPATKASTGRTATDTKWPRTHAGDRRGAGGIAPGRSKSPSEGRRPGPLNRPPGTARPKKTGEAAHQDGQPRRSDRIHQLSLAQILSHFRQNVEQKPCRPRHLKPSSVRRPSGKKNANDTEAAKHHHRSQQKTAVPEAYGTAADSPAVAKSRALRRTDVAR